MTIQEKEVLRDRYIRSNKQRRPAFREKYGYTDHVAFLNFLEGKDTTTPISEGKKKMVYIFCLDESGSMGGSKAAAVKRGTKAEIQRLQQIHDGTIELIVIPITFGDSVRVQPQMVAGVNLSDSFANNYHSRNEMTALNDAFLAALDEAEKHDTPHVFINVFTDGQENRSRATYSLVKTRVEIARNKNWAVTLIGSDRNVSLYAHMIGLSEGNVHQVSDDERGMKEYEEIKTRASATIYTNVSKGLNYDADSVISTAKGFKIK